MIRIMGCRPIRWRQNCPSIYAMKQDAERICVIGPAAFSAHGKDSRALFIARRTAATGQTLLASHATVSAL